MTEYDWQLASGAPPCVFSDSFYRTGRDAIFRQLTTETTHEQFQAALESLTRLRDELVQNLYPMHYGALIGRHRCVEDLYKEARARLRGLEIMQPAPEVPAPPPPAPPPKPRSLADVLKEFQGLTDAASEAADTDNGE
jgi:hypothetical protein